MFLAGNWAWQTNFGQIIPPVSANKGESEYDRPFNGHYVSFKYDSEYQVQVLSRSSDNDLETYMLRADTNYTKHLAVAVSQLPGGNLRTDSSYVYRMTTPDLYSGQTLNINNNYVSLWHKADDSEITAFIPRGNLVATFSFTTTSPTDNLLPEVDALLQSFHWN